MLACFRVHARHSLVLPHTGLLKPALQALWVVWGCFNQVLTHLAPLRSALQALWVIVALCGFLGAVFFGSDYPRSRFRPEGPISGSPGRSPG